MDLTKGKVSDHLQAIAIPASIGLFFNTMYNVIDTIFAGFISTQALAALSISFPVFFIMIAFVTGLSTGASALISNAIGNGQQGQIKILTAQILAFAIATYAIIAPICLYFSPDLFQLLGAKDEYLDMSVTFMNIIFKGSIFFILLYSANSILLAHGNSRVMRNYLVSGCLFNALLDPWFLYGGFGLPAMGLSGIALATVTVMFVGTIYIFYEARKEGYLRGIKWRDYIPQKHYFMTIAEQSFPASFNMMTIGIGIFIITYFVKNFGESAVAAYGICVRIEQVILLPTIGLSMAALSMVGQNNGAGEIDRVRDIISKSTFYGLIVVACGAVVMFSFALPLVSIFTQDQKVIDIGAHYLKIAAFVSGAYVVLSINVSALQGMKKPLFPLFIGLSRQIILPPLTFYLLANVLDYGITGIWYGVFVINWSAALITLLVCRHFVNRAQEEQK